MKDLKMDHDSRDSGGEREMKVFQQWALLTVSPSLNS